MKRTILTLKFRNPEQEEIFRKTVKHEPEVRHILKNHGATPSVIKNYCDWYGFNIEEMFYIDFPGREEL